jgi:hypothetical protein
MGADAVERHEHIAHAIGPLARRAALLVAVLAAFLAVAEVVGENAVKSVVTGEVRVVREVTLDRAHAVARLPEVDHAIEHDETRHSRFELSIVLLEVGIVLTSAAALIGVARLMLGGALMGVVGVAFLVAGMLA